MTFKTEIDRDGIATLCWDAADKPVNVWTEKTLEQFGSVVGALIDDPAVIGVVITSAKKVFHVGADLELALRFGALPADDLLRRIVEINKAFRRIETAGKPFAAAINGHALGGGLELALACHARFIADDDRVQIGLPETKLGLMPGFGGTQRLPRLVPITEAVSAIAQGKSFSPAEALRLGLATELAPRSELVARAKVWLKANPKARQPWDARQALPSGSVQDPANVQFFSAASALLRKQGYGSYPGPQAALEAIYHGLQMPIDQGLQVEARKFLRVCASAEAKAMIRTLFFGVNAAKNLDRRPSEPQKRSFSTVGLVGAGLMGGGIAYVAARAGLNVVLLDSSVEAAERGRAYSTNLLEKALKQGRLTQADRDAHLDRIATTTEYAALAPCDIVIEAVFETKAIKADVLERIEAAVAPTAIIASNTSTIPISELATYLSRPDRFIGLHFFSPVEKMPLVEIISGSSTVPATLAAAFDFCGSIGKTPIDVHDGRGFYTTRVVASYMLEGVALLAEGVHPALIENAGRMAGMPMGPLRLLDMTAIDLAVKIDAQNKADLGEAYRPMPGLHVARRMVELRRLGEKTKAGFYDHDGGSARLWPGLAAFGVRDTQPAVDEVIARLMTRQAVEMLRCMQDGVVKTAEDADLGSVLGWGFAPYTGGIASYVDRVGARRLLDLADRFAGIAGDRFAPPALLRELAASGRKLYAVAA
jgi:3-hydroxyacyl-CoA dehydrogenase / enoyl-CoA hydratase / 3-hydroxybutyryl-CoA epimerase